MVKNIKVGSRIALRRNMLQLGLPDVRGTVLEWQVYGHAPDRRVLVVRRDDGSETSVLESNVLLVSRIRLEAV